ncbi:MAG: 4Fe-4S binding protein, partial [Microcystaceae cyanobacterium]
MLIHISERQMHWVRWVLTSGWLLLIASLFYDPWTSTLTKSDHPWSPLRLADVCVKVQSQCLVEKPYALGATIFWGVVVPSGIFILLVFGHELWRRICPLSFLSQIPRALGWQRQFKRENKQTGKIRYELAKVKADSWLGKNYSYLQFGWLFVGLCGRILFFNADRLMLALWILLAIAAAIFVGYFYGGKSWCQYFCPMAPVQTIFSEPRGLLGSKPHLSDEKISQSMCRTVLPDKTEESACVACQSPCFDIDSERAYWEKLNKPQTSFVRYGYVGLVIGYFLYYYLYAGNWDYYFSGIWNRDPNQLASLMNPGLYLFGQAINIPKLWAVPLVLGSFTAIAIFLGQAIETQAKSYFQKYFNVKPEVVRHRLFAICTFGIFDFFFLFAGRPLLQLLPSWVQYLFDFMLLFLSTLWLQKTWNQSREIYSRESLAIRLRKQLEKLQLDVSQFLEGRSLKELRPNEIYVLAKVLIGFNREKRHQAYKGVVKESLEEGYVNSGSSLEILKQMRQELGVTDDEHRQVLEELGIEDPELLNPHRQWSLENQVRLNGYQKSLERILRLQQLSGQGIIELSQQDSSKIRSLNRDYSITAQEEEYLLEGFSPNTNNLAKTEFLLAKLTELRDRLVALDQPILQVNHLVIKVLQETIYHQQELIVKTILDSLTTWQNEPNAQAKLESLKQLVPRILSRLLAANNLQEQWNQGIINLLTETEIKTTNLLREYSTLEIVSHLEIL